MTQNTTTSATAHYFWDIKSREIAEIALTPPAESDDFIGYDMALVKQQAKAFFDEACENGLPQKDRDFLEQKKLEEFEQAGIELTTPTITPANVSPELRKHFVMVTPEKVISTHPVPNQPALYARWHNLRRAIQSTGAKVTTLKDMKTRIGDTDVYCRDSFIHVNGQTIFPDTQHANPRETFAAALQTSPNDTSMVLSKTNFQGGNFIVNDHAETIFYGVINDGKPSQSQNALSKALEKATKGRYKVVKVPLLQSNNADETKQNIMSGAVTDMLLSALGQSSLGTSAENNNHGGIYHLDLMMSEPLPNGEIIICPDSTTSNAYRKIERLIGADKIIKISIEEAQDGNANVLIHGDNVIISTPSPALKTQLEERGYTVITAQDYSTPRFGFNEAEAHCLANQLPCPC